MNPTAQLLLFADLILKSTLVLALALLAARLWQGTSAANRHLVWLAAFAVLLLVPFTRIYPPHWSWRPVQAAAPAVALAAPSLVPEPRELNSARASYAKHRK